MLRNAIVLLALVACDGAVDGETTAEGTATYEDAETASDGSEQQPARPDKGTVMEVTLEVDGTGDFSVGDPQCALDGTSFDALYEGEGEIDADGVYVASFAEADATFETPSGCEIPDLDIGLVTGVSVVARIENTSQQCSTYCSSKARSSAESECSGDDDEVSCRASAEAEYETSCQTACEDPETSAVVARASLGASAVADLAIGGLTGSALGTVQADLTFDHLEDADGNEVSENR